MGLCLVSEKLRKSLVFKYVFDFAIEPLLFRGIFSDFRKIFLWHESEDTNQKSLFPKFKLIPISRLFFFQVMHDYVCFIAHLDYWVE